MQRGALLAAFLFNVSLFCLLLAVARRSSTCSPIPTSFVFAGGEKLEPYSLTTPITALRLLPILLLLLLPPHLTD